MTQQEKVTNLLRLYELQKDCFDKRRSEVWKVLLSFWTAIIIGTAFLIHKVQLPKCSWYFYAILFIIFTFGWLKKVYYADELDHKWWEFYRNSAEKELGLRSIVADVTNPKRLGFLINGWFITLIVFTGLILFASWYLLYTTEIDLG